MAKAGNRLSWCLLLVVVIGTASGFRQRRDQRHGVDASIKAALNCRLTLTTFKKACGLKMTADGCEACVQQGISKVEDACGDKTSQVTPLICKAVGELLDESQDIGSKTLAEADKQLEKRDTNIKNDLDLGKLFGEMILIGEKVFEIIKAGEPVKNIETKMVSVMPSALSWNQMAGWSYSHANSVKVVNVKEVITKASVISLELTPMMFFGGSYQGSGRFLKDVKILPKAYCAWLHYLDVQVIASEPHNIGTTDNPIAEITLTADIKYGTIPAIQKWSKRVKFIFSGTGQIRVIQS